MKILIANISTIYTCTNKNVRILFIIHFGFKYVILKVYTLLISFDSLIFWILNFDS